MPGREMSNSELEKYRVRSGDILVARMADPGNVAFIDGDEPDAVFASYLVRLRSVKDDLSLFLYYFLRYPEYQEYASSVTSGSVQKNMNARVIVGTQVAVPSESILR